MIALTIEVAALDRDNDGVFELRGTTVRLMDLDVRNGDVPVIVLHAGAEAPIQIVASNLGDSFAPRGIQRMSFGTFPTEPQRSAVLAKPCRVSRIDALGQVNGFHFLLRSQCGQHTLGSERASV